MKALEKDRTRRYETANGLALDVERYLADEPVEACPPSRRYQVRKFVRRHQGPVVAASAILLALLVGTGVSLWQAIRATAAAASERRALLDLGQEQVATRRATRAHARGQRAGNPRTVRLAHRPGPRTA